MPKLVSKSPRRWLERSIFKRSATKKIYLQIHRLQQAQQITASIQSLSMSLQQLSKEAEAIPVEEHTAKRQRIKEPVEDGELMEDGKPKSFH